MKCTTCKHIQKLFDGMCGETWICLELPKKVSILDIPHKLDTIFRFIITDVDFGCTFWKDKNG